MRIGFFSDSYFPEIDGVTYTLKTWKEELEERGHEVYIIYPDGDYEPSENEIPVHSVSNPFYSGYNIPLPTLRDFPDMDIVHCHSPGTVGIQGLIYAKRNNIPSVYTHHTPLEEYFEQHLPSKKTADLLGKLYVPVESWYLRRFDKVTANTEDINRKVETDSLPVGIDTDFFRPTEEGFDFQEPTVGYSGRMSSEKNVNEICRLAEENPEWRFVLVGEGPKRETLEVNSPQNVEFKDFLERPQLPKFYSSIDVFVTASTGDTLGLSTLEANACGTPVVSPDVHPFDRTIEEGNGLRYEKGDLDDFTKKVKSALESEWETRKNVREYSLDRSMKKLLEIYSSVDQQ